MTYFLNTKRVRRFTLLFVLLLICVGLLATASLALSVQVSRTDDHGIIAISSAQNQNCPNGTEYDYSTGECVAINHDND